MGQLITYAAGLEAVTIVWIAPTFTDQHRAALDWLNNISANHINFFGWEVELWRIGNSAVAPKFNVVSKPNTWVKAVTAVREQSEKPKTAVDVLQLEFWQSFVDYLKVSGSFLRPRTPQATYYLGFAIGRSRFGLRAGAYFVHGTNLSVHLMIRGSHAGTHYAQLYAQREAIEVEIGRQLTWKEHAEKTYSIGLINNELNPNYSDEWPANFAWLKANLETFHRAFERRIRLLTLSENEPDLV